MKSWIKGGLLTLILVTVIMAIGFTFFDWTFFVFLVFLSPGWFVVGRYLELSPIGFVIVDLFASAIIYFLIGALIGSAMQRIRKRAGLSSIAWSPM